MEKAVVLLSGGLDSTVCMAVARSKGLEVYPISFNYHQRHSIELESAKKVAAFYNVKKHLIIETNMEAIGGSALTDDKIAVPDGDFDHGAEDIPITYVPARNLIFLSYAMGYAEVIGANQIFIGVNEAQGKGYGTEATKLFSDYGFKALKLHRISLRVFERNVAAIKCYETAGFKREGLFKDMVCFDGIYENILFMAKIK